jgi:hypothetical protein
MGPLSLQLLEKGWKTLFEAAETSAKTPEERLEELRSLSQDDIMQKFGPRTTFSPLGDGKFLLTSWRLGDPHPDSRCAGIIIGNVGIEWIVFNALTLLLPQTIFNKSIPSSFKRASDAELFCNFFRFAPAGEQTPEAYLDAICFFISVVLFHFPELRVTETYKGKVYHYHFEEPSPYEGKLTDLRSMVKMLFLYTTPKGMFGLSLLRKFPRDGQVMGYLCLW